jgi:hypothetical protein
MLQSSPMLTEPISVAVSARNVRSPIVGVTPLSSLIIAISSQLYQYKDKDNIPDNPPADSQNGCCGYAPSAVECFADFAFARNDTEYAKK